MDSAQTESPQDQALRRYHERREAFDRDGYVIFENILSEEETAAIRAALAPWMNRTGRNDFEGLSTNRVYALLAKSPVFADLAAHPLAMAFVEGELGTSCLLSACLAINLHPGESVQPWHHDDSHIDMPRPRKACGVSAFWAIDAMTETNGATEILPGSHLWPEDDIPGAVAAEHFADRNRRDAGDDPGARPDAMKVVMPAGSLMLAKGTLWHRGGANRSDAPRLIITPQYCAGWARPLENMSLAVPPAIARGLPARARELLGYSIHEPFMGYVDGAHPRRVLEN
ncbi:phytanoyl-CoA dioxygenase family protein [Euryhalocaulis caribicus]|uniref:phytanoyl-CoA dioxygenase family protein n=1 Tax=Euryhalocaulis caribicus TaxID=1161401 RepID=UPI0003A9CC70|nr:phytanoyl-CoA dioxygenase family protein [Euryhalocaulis caribicus]